METKQYFIGVDLGKKVDYSVIAVVEKEGEILKLVFMKRFPLETPYASVIGYLKCIYEKMHPAMVYVDQTGIGEFVVEEIVRSGIVNTIGVILTLPKKQEILGVLKQKMMNDLIRIPYDADLIAEINIEKFELTKEGQIKFSHPEGSHDDRLWAFALAVYAASQSLGKIGATTGKVW